MPEEKTTQTAAGAKEADKEPNPFAAPSISLPKGGGAIKGIGEKFGVNPVNGTGTLSVPVFTSPGRSKFTPNLSLSYDSGAGNGPFGFGWHLSVPNITRKTDKGLPRYLDTEESDVFILSEAEDLVPVLLPVQDEWRKDTFTRTKDGETYTIQHYRPRIEGLFARIERWRNDATGEIFWSSISKDNVTSLFGTDSSSRIADPADPSRVFTWLLAATYDDKGNLAVYEYKAEDGANVPSSPHEENRKITANRYLKRIKYCNRSPYYATTSAAFPDDWCFEVVFDYGEHHQANPRPIEDVPWRCRPDPFSRYRATFEVRTYRICSRVLMFHHFPEELGTPDYLVRSTHLTYSFDEQPTDPLNPFYAYVQSIKQVGYRRQSDGTYYSKAMPPLEFTYTKAEIDETIHFADPASLENVPSGVNGSRYQWVDLDSEGSPGILTEQANGWFYKRNISSLPGPDGRVTARFEPAELVALKPSVADLSGTTGQQLMDLAGDGRLSLVQFARPIPGYYERDENGEWQSFAPFASCPNIDWKDPNLRTVDLDSDGFADILITESEVFTWYPSRAKEGFGASETVRKPFDEDEGPALLFADGTESIYLADASGDGLKDLVRIRNGEICYWPNLGYGRFGAKIRMDNSPLFDSPDLFDQKRVRPADIDGTGTMDIIYLGGDRITVWCNQSGNGFGPPQEILQFPATDDVDSVNVADLLGNGTACLVWSSPLPGDSSRPLRYIDLMGGQKPHLLVGIKNNLGAETRVQYVPSSKFYLADRAAGRPWVRPLSFPVHVVERVDTFDWVSRNRFVTRYAYHHGYFDGFEREFRGFGMVEQQDTEELGALSKSGSFPDSTNIDAASYVPPVLTKTWFHTGAFFDGVRISRAFAHEYYRESDLAQGVTGLTDAQFEAMELADTVVADGLTADESREAVRSLKGATLRQEIYALDGTLQADQPYSVSEENYTIKRLQPFGGNRHAVFFTHARESIDLHYERKLYTIEGRKLADPRVGHKLVLAVDDYGNELRSVAIGYGRRQDDPDPLLTADDHKNQAKIHVTCTDSSYTNPILDADVYRVPLPAETRTYELINVAPDRKMADITNLFSFNEIAGRVNHAADGQHDLPYEDLYAAGATANQPYRRLIEHVRSLYSRDDLTGALPLGTIESRAIVFQNYKLAFTPGLLALYQGNQQNLLTNAASMFRDMGGYVLSDDPKSIGLFPTTDSSGCWWIPAGRIFLSPGATDTPAQELAFAQLHFFMPHRYQDPFGKNTTVTYDAYHLLLLETEDPVHNKVSAGQRDALGQITPKIDYRVLQASLITDPNRNRSQVVFDCLGLVVGTAIMGKSDEHDENKKGDLLDEKFLDDLDPGSIAGFFNADDPVAQAPAFLQQASTRIIYDLDRYKNTSASLEPQPATVTTLVRETHASIPVSEGGLKIQVTFSYSDGFGREIQKKIPAEPGKVDVEDDAGNISSVDTTPNLRWVGTGWTIFNNKGNPVCQYEPFFSTHHSFQFGKKVGVSPVLFYDPLERVVATLHPNQTYEKVVFDPWQQKTYDVNDTVAPSGAETGDPRTDPDIKDYVNRYFANLAASSPAPAWQTWYAQRIGGLKGEAEQEAAQKAAAHGNTPTLAYFDTLGRTFLTVTQNRFSRQQSNGSTVTIEEKYPTRVELDIEGNQRRVRDAIVQNNDAHGRIVMRYDYDMLGNRVHQSSMEAGERWVLSDVTGKPIRAWDSRGFISEMTYDEARRPTGLFVSGNGLNHVLAERTVYGEDQQEGPPDPETKNHRGRVYKVFDSAGIVTSGEYDFKGNLLESTRDLLPLWIWKQGVNWAQNLEANDGAFITRTAYDALNRPLAATSPDGSVYRPTFNEANLLEKIDVNLRGATAPTHFVTNIDYNAKGQRELIEYGNKAKTNYEYDNFTFRLTRMHTTRPTTGNGLVSRLFNGQSIVQDLHYTYDPAGNITRIADDSLRRLSSAGPADNGPCDYTYDAVYRLTEAIGREHIGQTARDANAQNRRDYDFVGLADFTAHPNDLQAMRRYSEAYEYDAVGNFKVMRHTANGSGWTRTYEYDEATPIEPAKKSNRLTRTIVGNFVETYTYKDSLGNDVDGCITAINSMKMAWDFKDQLQQVDLGGGGTAYFVYDASGQRVRKVIETQGGKLSEELLYLGGFEIYRKFNGNPLVRDTLHVMDHKQRIALVETKTHEFGAAILNPEPVIRYQLSNHLDSASLELDEESRLISYEEYHPYGTTAFQTVSSAEVSLKRYRYTGKERDDETGLNYYGARYYASWLGRWTTIDPAGLVDGSNLYVSMRCNPVCMIDPTGNQSDKIKAIFAEGRRKRKEQELIYSANHTEGYTPDEIGDIYRDAKDVPKDLASPATPKEQAKQQVRLQVGRAKREVAKAEAAKNPPLTKAEKWEVAKGSARNWVLDKLSVSPTTAALFPVLLPNALLTRFVFQPLRAPEPSDTPSNFREYQAKQEYDFMQGTLNTVELAASFVPVGEIAQAGKLAASKAWSAVGPTVKGAAMAPAFMFVGAGGVGGGSSAAAGALTKAPIIGNPQVTSPGHAEKMIEIANEMTHIQDMEGVAGASKVFMHSRWTTITEGEVASRKLPDVAMVSKTGGVTAVEVPSPSDIRSAKSFGALIARNLKVLLGMGAKSEGLFIIHP